MVLTRRADGDVENWMGLRGMDVKSVAKYIEGRDEILFLSTCSQGWEADSSEPLIIAQTL